MPATDWNSLLQQLGTAPRENGSAALDATAGFLADTLRSLGWQVENVPFTAYPYEQRVLGILLFAGAAAYWWSMRTRRFGWATALALALPLVVWLHFDHGLRVSLGVGAVTEQNVVARLEVPEPQRYLVLSAHYDTKTDLLDHILRSPLQIFGLPTGLLMVVIAFGSYVALQVDKFSPRRRQAATLMAWVALAYGLASFAVFTAGAFLRERSPGAIDDGAACATLLRLADELARDKPARTAVELVFFAGEELSVQGSRSFVTDRAARLDARRPLVVNLESIGPSTHLAVVGRESTFLKHYEPAPEVVALLDRVHRDLAHEPLPVTPLGGLADAFSFLDRGIPAATVLQAVPPFILPRRLHSSADSLDRIVPGALDQALDFLRRVVRVVDAPA